MGNGRKQTWKRVRGRESREDLSPSLPNPAPSPFFPAHFSLLFPNYLKACLQANYVHSFISNFLWYIFNLSTFGALLLIIGKGIWYNYLFNSVLDWETVFFFFLNFFFVSFYRIFYTYFPLLSPVSLTPPPPLPSSPRHLLQTRANGHLLQIICSRPFDRLFRVLGLRKKCGPFCGLKDFVLIDVLVSRKL